MGTIKLVAFPTFLGIFLGFIVFPNISTYNTYTILKLEGNTWFCAKSAIWTISLLLIICLISYGQMTLTRRARMANQFPQGIKCPLIGHLYIFFCKPENVLGQITKYRKNFGRCSGFWFGRTPYVIIMNAEIAQKILSSNRSLDKGQDYDAFKWLLGDGLITSKTSIWKDDRKLLNPGFKYKMLAGFRSSFNKHSRTLVHILEENLNDVNSTTNLYPLLSRFTIDSISESALGKFYNAQMDAKCEFAEVTKLALECFRTRLFKPWMAVRVIRNLCGVAKDEARALKGFKDVFDLVIKERKELMRNKNTESESETIPFIDLLLDSKSDKNIMDHMITIFGAGFETTANAMNYTLFLLALYPDCQQRVCEELKSIFGDEVNRDVTFADLSQMKYLEMCIKESLRLYPPAPAMIRAIDEDIPLGDGRTIPNGCNVAFLLYELHRDENVFKQPAKFIPERFETENYQNLSPFAYIPFSVGARSCIGQKYAMVQMKIALAHILRHFEISTTTKENDLKLVFGMVLELAKPIQLHLRKRQNST